MQKLFSQDSIAVLIAGTRRSIKQYGWEKLRPWKVTPQQCGVLMVLHTEGGMSLGEVAGRIWCDNPTACRIVNKLVERGLVRSDSDATDRRRFRLQLTETGKALSVELTQCVNEIYKTLEQGLEPSQLDTLRSLLRHIMGNALGATHKGDKEAALANTYRPTDKSKRPEPVMASGSGMSGVGDLSSFAGRAPGGGAEMQACTPATAPIIEPPAE